GRPPGCEAVRPGREKRKGQGEDERDSTGAVLAARGPRTGPHVPLTLPGRTAMMLEFAVGMNIAGKHESVTVAAEDALIAALKVKCERPDAVINYMRRRHKRGDLRHLHGSIAAQDGCSRGTLMGRLPMI